MKLHIFNIGLQSSDFQLRAPSFRIRTSTFGLAALSVLPALHSCKKEETKQAPNIIFILADDLGWADVGYQGSNFYETPNLDKLANAGTQFTSAYTNAPNSAPTRACIMTGMHVQRHGITSVHHSMKGEKRAMKLLMPETLTELDTTYTTIPELMKKAGYNTSFFGKWHLGEDPINGPIAHGFDYNVAGCHWGAPKTYFSPYKHPILEDGFTGENLTDRLTDEAINYLDTLNKDNPFFVYMSYHAVHTPLQTKDSLLQKYKQKQVVDGQSNPKYAGMIETLDNNIGKLNQYLEDNGLAENTLVIFYSDNGGSFRATVNDPLRGCKGSLREGGVRVPCFFYQPGTVPSGRKVDVPIITTDILPTLVDIANTEYVSIDGESVWSLVTGEKELEREAIYWYEPVYLYGKPKDGYLFRLTASAAIRKGDYKLNYFFDDKHIEMFNITKDISEANEISASEPEKAKELKEDLLKWLEETDAKTEFEINPEYDSTFKPDVEKIYL